MRLAAALASLAALSTVPLSGAAGERWEPTRPIQLVVPAGQGGGADQMARAIQSIVAQHRMTPRPIVVVHKPGGAGAEAFLETKAAHGNPHVLLITLSNLFTTPLATGIPFSWRDLTPVTMLALDEFVLWVNAEAPYTTVAEFLAAARASRLRIGGTGSRQEDQLIAAAITRATGIDFAYLPYAGGGTVAAALAGRHVDATVNNPIEAVTHWRVGVLRPLCVFDSKRLAASLPVTDSEGWHDIPSCREAGLAVDYVMPRALFMASGVTEAQVAFYTELIERVRETPEWHALMREGAFRQSSMSGAPLAAWLAEEEERHRALMVEAGFIPAR